MSRNKVTIEHYPDKIRPEEFMNEITDEITNQAFINNMLKLKIKKQYPEEWMQNYTTWMEMNNGKVSFSSQEIEIIQLFFKKEDFHEAEQLPKEEFDFRLKKRELIDFKRKLGL